MNFKGFENDTTRIGRTVRLLEAGRTVADVAKVLSVNEEKVLEYIRLIELAAANCSENRE